MANNGIIRNSLLNYKLTYQILLGTVGLRVRKPYYNHYIKKSPVDVRVLSNEATRSLATIMWRFTALAFLATAAAQIPSLGWCPDMAPMNNFSMDRFLGTWYEAERYFTVSELGSRCVTTNYAATPEGRIVVSNEIIGALTGFK